MASPLNIRIMTLMSIVAGRRILSRPLKGFFVSRQGGILRMTGAGWFFSFQKAGNENSPPVPLSLVKDPQDKDEKSEGGAGQKPDFAKAENLIKLRL